MDEMSERIDDLEKTVCQLVQENNNKDQLGGNIMINIRKWLQKWKINLINKCLNLKKNLKWKK